MEHKIRNLVIALQYRAVYNSEQCFIPGLHIANRENQEGEERLDKLFLDYISGVG